MDVAEENQINSQHEHCDPATLERAMRLLGDMRTLGIIYLLLQGSRRFGELLEGMGGVSPKTLSQRLKLLEEQAFLTRHAYAEIPPRVEYSLTEKGRALGGILYAIEDFAINYLGGRVNTGAGN